MSFTSNIVFDVLPRHRGRYNVKHDDERVIQEGKHCDHWLPNGCQRCDCDLYW